MTTHFASVGLNGAPFSPDFALVKWTDTSTSAIGSIKYMGFTNGERASTLDYGANCVLLKTQYNAGQSPYVQVSPQQIQQLQYQLGQNNYYNPNIQVKDWLLQMYLTDVNRNTQSLAPSDYLANTLRGNYPAKTNLYYSNKNGLSR